MQRLTPCCRVLCVRVERFVTFLFGPGPFLSFRANLHRLSSE